MAKEDFSDGLFKDVYLAEEEVRILYGELKLIIDAACASQYQSTSTMFLLEQTVEKWCCEGVKAIDKVLIEPPKKEQKPVKQHKIERFTMNSIRSACKDMAEKYREKNIGLVLGVATGGVIPAYLVAQKLKMETKYRTLRPNQPLPTSLCKFSGNILIIDDIEDSGKTREEIGKLFEGKNFFFETLCKKEEFDKWYLFPWETEQDSIGERQTKYNS